MGKSAGNNNTAIHANKNHTSSTHSYNSNSIHKQLRKKTASKDDEEDGLMFANLLQKDNSNAQHIVQTNMQQTLQNQQIFKLEDEDKKDNQRIDTITKNETQNINDIQQAETNYTTQFTEALKDNHNKHNFEVNLPKLGTFRITTESSGQKLHFGISAKEKLAYDWIRTHQTSIAKNVSNDLGMDVSLGIEYAI